MELLYCFQGCLVTLPLKSASTEASGQASRCRNYCPQLSETHHCSWHQFLRVRTTGLARGEEMPPQAAKLGWSSPCPQTARKQLRERRRKPTLREKYYGYATYLIPGTEGEELWKFPLFENKNTAVSPPEGSLLISQRVLTGQTQSSTTAEEVTEAVTSYFSNIRKGGGKSSYPQPGSRGSLNLPSLLMQAWLLDWLLIIIVNY